MSDYKPMSKMTECCKCGSGNITGPRYTATPYGSEYLQYTCCRCGYSENHPTKDAKPIVITRLLDGTASLPINDKP